MESRPRFYTATEAAALLRIDVSTVYDLLKAGELAGDKIGESWRIGADDLWRRFNQRRPVAEREELWRR